MIFLEPNLYGQRKNRSRNVLHSQSRLDLIDCIDAVGAVSVGDGGVPLTGTVAEQQDPLAVKGIFRPSDV